MIYYLKFPSRINYKFTFTMKKSTCFTHLFLVSLFVLAFICGPTKKKEGKIVSRSNPYYS